MVKLNMEGGLSCSSEMWKLLIQANSLCKLYSTQKLLKMFSTVVLYTMLSQKTVEVGANSNSGERYLIDITASASIDEYAIIATCKEEIYILLELEI